MAIQQEFTFPSSDGLHQVHAVEWLPEEGEPKAVIQLVHGISEHMARYTPFANFLTEHGYAVVGHDHLGHGHTATSPKEYGFFAERNGGAYVLRDTHTRRKLAGEKFPNLPYILLGHSMGSFVVRGYLMAWPGTVDAAILSGTGQETPFRINAARMLSGAICTTQGPRTHSALLDSLSVGAYNKQFAPNRTRADWISRDEAVVDAYLADPLCRFSPTAGMYHDMMLGLQSLVKPANLARLDPDTPIYLFAGDRDPVGASGAGVRQVTQMLRSAGVRDVTMKLYPGARHECLNEINREQVYQDTLDWIEQHLPQD